MTDLETLLTLARASGAADRPYSHFTSDDEVSALVERVYAIDGAILDTDAIEAAYCEGRAELRTKTWRVCWTTAPCDYDYENDVEVIDATGTFHGKPLRKLAIRPESFAYLSSRYGSGLHPTWEEDPRETDRRIAERIEADKLEREQRERNRTESLASLRSWTDATVEAFDGELPAGLTWRDLDAERKRRRESKEATDRAASWTTARAAFTDGATLIDDGEPAKRGTYGVIQGRDPRVYYNATVSTHWAKTDDAEEATVNADAGETVGSLAYVAEWLRTGRLRIARDGEVPPLAVVARIGQREWRSIRRVEVSGRVVWIGRPTWKETLVLDGNGRIVRAKKIVEAALAGLETE